MHDDGTPPAGPTRHLRPVHLDEPPDDPHADNPPQPADVRPDGRHAIADTNAERALLGTLLAAPNLGRQLANHVTPDDFWFPVHADLWTTWHQLANDLPNDQGPDAITLAAHATRSKNADLARLVTDLHGNDRACPNPLAGDTYARIVRDTARLRTVDALATTLRQLATTGTPDTIDRTLAEALQRLDDTATRFGPTDGPTSRDTGLADLSWINTGARPTNIPPRWCTRRDGTALFYAGRHNGLFGDPESGKTWLAQCAGIEALNNGGTFAMIDVDHNGQEHTAARLALLGAAWDDIANPDKFRYYEPEDGDQLKAAVADITALAPDVVIIDSLGEVLPMLGVKSVDNDEITAALRTIVMPPAKAGSCVISVDHLPKSAEARSTGFAIGGTAKKRAVDGAYLRVDAKIKPAPGQVGRIMLRIEKDRTGELRKTSPGGYAGTFTLDSSSFDPSTPSDQQGATRWWIGRDETPRNDDGSFRPTSLMEKVATYIGEHENCTQRDIERDIPGTAKFLRDAIKVLVSEGHVARVPGPGRSNLHVLLIPYREAEDDHATPTD